MGGLKAIVMSNDSIDRQPVWVDTILEVPIGIDDSFCKSLFEGSDERNPSTEQQGVASYPGNFRKRRVSDRTLMASTTPKREREMLVGVMKHPFEQTNEIIP